MTAPLPLFHPEQIRAMERQAIEQLGIASHVLMERAGAAAWQILQARWPTVRTVGVVCGPGNNGGDGYVLAELAKQDGRAVTVIVLPDGAPRTDDSQKMFSRWRAGGGAIEPFNAALPEVDVWVDALYGIGLDRPPSGVAQALIERLNATHKPVLALDVPSGIEADRGIALGAAVKANVTVSFIAAKRGLYSGSARDYAGEVCIASLDTPDSLRSALSPAALLYRQDQLGQGLAPRHGNAHKGEFGHVLCIGGDHGMSGAVLLCAEAALRTGAGLASVATRTESVAALVAARPEAMTHAVDNAEALNQLIKNADVLALGPGLGRGEWGSALFEAALASGKPLVLDADGLNLLSVTPRLLPQAILTPHPGEAARLLGLSNEQIQQDRFFAVEELARRFACVVVLKGAGTLVAAPGQITVVIGTGNPGMATGGMGDVLTGVIAALRGQGLAPFDAAIFGALLHGAAGDASAKVDGERGLLPSDLFGHLRRLANP